MARDTLFSGLDSDLDQFVFDERVTAVFADMIRRSVPGYASVISMTGVIAADAVARLREKAAGPLAAYDLGCSLGAGLLAMGKLLPDDVSLVGVDTSAPMLDACRQACAGLAQPLELLESEAQKVVIENAAAVVMNYTLQFISPGERQALIQRIYAGLQPGGVLLVSEKLRFSDPGAEARMTGLYHAFKRQNGYSELEIAKKRNALENVLISDSENTHRARFSEAGFVDVERWYQCLNFASFVAYKPI